jgi:hypothetical protein
MAGMNPNFPLGRHTGEGRYPRTKGAGVVSFFSDIFLPQLFDSGTPSL